MVFDMLTGTSGMVDPQRRRHTVGAASKGALGARLGALVGGSLEAGVRAVSRPDVLLPPASLLPHVAAARVPKTVGGTHPDHTGTDLVAVKLAAAVTSRSAHGAEATSAGAAVAAARLQVLFGGSAGSRRSKVSALLARSPPQLALVGIRLALGVADGLQGFGTVPRTDTNSAFAAGSEAALYALARVTGSPGCER